MNYDPDLLDQLEELGAAPWAGRLWKYLFGETYVFRENTRGARWNPPDCPAIYTSLGRDGAVAEGAYLISTQGIPPSKQRYLYEIEATLSRVVDLSASATLGGLGIEREELTTVDFGKCPYIGGAADYLGFDGIKVPSARSEDTHLVILTRNLEIGDNLRQVERYEVP